jgi:hypothetical protein
MNNASPITTEAIYIVSLLNFAQNQQKVLNDARIIAHISKGEGLFPEEEKVLSLAEEVAKLTKNVQHRLNSSSPAVLAKVAAISAFHVVKPE